MGIEFSPQHLDRLIGDRLRSLSFSSNKFCVALSGGLDSSVLLLALAQLRELHPAWSVRAIHINHQLQSGSDAWAERCLAFAQRIDVPLIVKQVVVNRDHTQGLESAAREVRYAALAEELQADEVLMTAHHADDQLETLLLALMRGAGVRGLAAMPICSAFAGGWHMRPLLSFTRDQLHHWAREQAIDAVEDPSNLNVHHDRNYLRHQVLPQLRERWPAAATNATRSTQHLGEASQLLDELAANDCQHCAVGKCLSVELLRVLPDARRRNLLRYWLRQQGFDAPSTRVLHAIEHDMLNAAADRNPMIDWPNVNGGVGHVGVDHVRVDRGNVEVHRYRGLLYALISLPPLPERQWNWREGPLQLPIGSLRIAPSARGLSAESLPATFVVRGRREGESIELSGRQHQRLLKRVFQEAHVLPWWRDCLPLLCDSKVSGNTFGTAGESIIAIADLFTAQHYMAVSGEPALQVIWDERPSLLCQMQAKH